MAAGATTAASTTAARSPADPTGGSPGGTPLAGIDDPAEAMSDTDAPWVTTTPEARLNAAPGAAATRDSLPPGTRLLDEFEVVRVLGSGGFGIVYLARDHLLQRDVAIKEYLPALLARRGD